MTQTLLNQINLSLPHTHIYSHTDGKNTISKFDAAETSQVSLRVEAAGVPGESMRNKRRYLLTCFLF